MKIYLKAKVVLMVLAMLSTITVSQTADDDEVDISVPNYPYKFYSGKSHTMQAISCSVS